jgi:peptidase M48-like protein
MNTTVPRAPRLDMLRFPSDTDARFALLIAAAAGASLFAYDWLVLGLLREAFNNIYRACDQAGATIPMIKVCVEPFERWQASLICVGVALLFVVALVIYWVFPAAMIRRRRLIALDDAGLPAIAAALIELSRLAGLRRPPIALLDPLNTAGGGLVFGRIGARYIVLQGGLVARFFDDRATFRAVVLHELAHLRNGDVDKTFFALSIWYAFVVVALAPLGLSLLIAAMREDAAELSLGVLLRAAALTAVVRATLASVLRAREIAADLRAASWDGATGALRRTLESLPPIAGAWWRRGLAWHPAPALRRGVLDDPAPLLRVGVAQGFGTGIVTAMALPELITLAALLLPARMEQHAGLVAALLVAPLAAASVGVPIWRVMVAALVGAAPAPRATSVGVGLGLGIITGLALSLYMSIRAPLFAGALPTPGAVAFALGWAALFIAGLALFARWVIDTASLWAERVASGTALAAAQTLALGVAGIVLASWVGPLAVLLGWGWDGVQLLLAMAPLPALTMRLIASPVTQGLLLGLWTVPLAAGLCRPVRSSALDWALADGVMQDVALPSLRLRWAAATGLAASVGFGILLVVVRGITRLILPEIVRASEPTRALFVNGQIGAAVVVQALVALAVASRVPRVGWAHGLLAAWVAGWGASAVIVGLVQAGYCVAALAFGPGHSCAERVDAGLLWFFAGPITQIGAVAALPAALMGAGLAALIRARRSLPAAGSAGLAPRPQ